MAGIVAKCNTSGRCCVHSSPVDQGSTVILGQLPTRFTQFEVYVLKKYVDGRNDLYEKVGIAWPNEHAAEQFVRGFERRNAWARGKTKILEKTTTYVVPSDYEEGTSAHAA